MTRFPDRLAQLRGVWCEGVRSTGSDVEIDGTIMFSDGTTLSAHFWRLTSGGRAKVSSFDHRHQYGLSAPIDALSVLRSALVGRQLLEAEMDRTTGDLRFSFEGAMRLEVFNFTGYEIWEITFPDGTGQYSNYFDR